MATHESDTARHVHFVGSVQAADTEAAMGFMLASAGQYLQSVPDGETYAPNWLVERIMGDEAQGVQGLRNHPDLEAHAGPGGVPMLAVRSGRQMQAESLLPFLGYATRAREGMQVLDRLADRYPAARGLTYQVGIPTPFGFAAAAFGPSQAGEYVSQFAEATAAEICKIQEAASAAGRQVVFQLETPVEAAFVANSPAEYQAAVSRQMAEMLCNMAAELPATTKFGAHICVGDRNHQPNMPQLNIEPLVLFTNDLIGGWPDSDKRPPLEFVHMPFASGAWQASFEQQRYAGLGQLALPGTTRLLAGVVSENQSLAELRRVVHIIDEAAGQRVDVAAPCGYGRYAPENVLPAVRKLVELATTS